MNEAGRWFPHGIWKPAGIVVKRPGRGLNKGVSRLGQALSFASLVGSRHFATATVDDTYPLRLNLLILLAAV